MLSRSVVKPFLSFETFEANHYRYHHPPRPTRLQPKTTLSVSPASSRNNECESVTYTRRALAGVGWKTTALLVLTGLFGRSADRSIAAPVSSNDDFTVTPSGLRLLDLKVGGGAKPNAGAVVVVDWAGYTKGYQGKRIGNTTIANGKDEPFRFILGGGEAIKAFEEAVEGMRVGGVRRIEIPGDRPELGYPLDTSQRFVSTGVYRLGPQPADLGGRRALDFVLDNPTLQDFNKTLLFDIKLLSVR